MSTRNPAPRSASSQPDPIPTPRPWLTVQFAPSGEVANIPIDVPGQLHLQVGNEGNLPAWTCYLELHDGGPTDPVTFADLELRDRRVLTLQPGESRVIALNWVRHRPKGRAFGVCYDPLLDPRPPIAIDHSRTPHDHYVDSTP
jgi:hypothetical protein